MNSFNNVYFGQKAFIINDKKQILIIKRKNVTVYKDIWDFPGGKLEDNEYLYAAIVREIKEETGLQLNRIIAILSTSKFIGIVKSRPVVFRNLYLCKASGQVKLSAEHSLYKWINIAEFKKYNFPPKNENEDLYAVMKNLPNLLKKLDLKKSYSLLL
ncbi:MAG TPA: NUDIX domain-containing protein [Candidatus Dojkabacteria bacterium]|nr:NUDIX domain-containing protein [Candidatus Dojkabacteria bacterium]